MGTLVEGWEAQARRTSLGERFRLARQSVTEASRAPTREVAAKYDAKLLWTLIVEPFIM